MRRFVHRKLIIPLALILMGAIGYTQYLADTTLPVTENLPTAKRIEVLPFVTESGWGYTIFIQGKPYIRQNSIPALEGNRGFHTREKALKAGLLVAYKISHSIFPPTIGKHELDSLHLID